MINQNIRLIYSSSCSKNKNGQKKVLKEQLGLFDAFTTVKFIFIPVADVSPHSFVNIISKNEPYMLLDTREFPDFFSVFISTEHALDEFRKNGIHYCRLPILDEFNKNESSWAQLRKLKSIVNNHIEKKTNSPIIVLSSTKSNLNRVSNKMVGYIKQEITNITFENIED